MIAACSIRKVCAFARAVMNEKAFIGLDRIEYEKNVPQPASDKDVEVVAHIFTPMNIIVALRSIYIRKAVWFLTNLCTIKKERNESVKIICRSPGT